MNGERRVNQQDRRSDNRWQVDRHIPVAVIIALLFQTGTGIWYARGLDATVAQAVKENDKQERRIESLESARISAAISESRLIAIENELRTMRVVIEQLSHQRQAKEQK